VDDDSYKFSESGVFFAPPKGSYEDYLEYIKGLPQMADPEAFGMHQNAEISKDMNDTNLLFDTVLLTLPRQTGGGGKSPNEVVDELASDILAKVREPFDPEVILKRWPIMYEESMNTVINQECERYNNTIKTVRSSLINVKKAIVGQVVMSSELEELFQALIVGKQPPMWKKASYPSLKPLGGYVSDFVQRLEFMTGWGEAELPVCFWISGIYFTHAFLTAGLQNFARKHTLPIDSLEYEFKIWDVEMSDYERLDESDRPEDGVLVWGLFLEGARLDRTTKLLTESESKVLYDQYPVMHLNPAESAKRVKDPHYLSPLYRTSDRRGILRTTGHSSNFVMEIEIPSDLPEEHWVTRGVALLTMLDD
jgi:dynein heavy chain